MSGSARRLPHSTSWASASVTALDQPRPSCGELRQHVLAAQVHDEPALGGDERQHHPAVQSGVLGRQVGEGLEPSGIGLRRFVCHRSAHGGRWAGRNVDDPSTGQRFRPRRRLCSVRAMAPEPPSIRIRTDELRTVREAMRDFGSLLTELEDGRASRSSCSLSATGCVRSWSRSSAGASSSKRSPVLVEQTTCNHLGTARLLRLRRAPKSQPRGRSFAFLGAPSRRAHRPIPNPRHSRAVAGREPLSSTPGDAHRIAPDLRQGVNSGRCAL